MFVKVCLRSQGKEISSDLWTRQEQRNLPERAKCCFRLLPSWVFIMGGGRGGGGGEFVCFGWFVVWFWFFSQTVETFMWDKLKRGG